MSKSYDINAKINGLIPNHTYNYEFVGSTNWPIAIVPLSGSFTAIDYSQSIMAVMYFCPTETECQDNNLIECLNECDIAPDESFCLLRLRYYDINNTDNKYYSNFTKISNSGYHLPSATLTTSSTIVKELDRVEMSATCSNLIPNSSYYYEFQNIDFNYTNIIYPQSGYFIPNSTDYNIVANLALAKTNIATSNIKPSETYFNSINLLIKPSGSDSSYTSNILKINFIPNDPTINLSFSNLNSSEEYKTIYATISGLMPEETYNYSFLSKGSNWPTIITEKTGTFIANDSVVTLDALFYVCPNIVSCTGNNNLLSWNDTLSGYDKDLFTNISMTIYPTGEPSNTSQSNILGFKHTLKTPKAILDIDPSGYKNVPQNVNIEFSDLKPNKLYNYRLNSIEANWPFVLSNTSGQFFSQDTTYTLSLIGSFCDNSGLCSNDSYGVLNFNAVSLPKTSWYKPQVSIILSFEDSDFDDLTYYSNIEYVLCQDCVSTNKNVTISVNQIPEI